MDREQPLARASIQIARVSGLRERCCSDIKDRLTPQSPAAARRRLLLINDKGFSVPLDGDIRERSFHVAHVRIVVVALHAVKVFRLAVPPDNSQHNQLSTGNGQVLLLHKCKIAGTGTPHLLAMRCCGAGSRLVRFELYLQRPLAGEGLDEALHVRRGLRGCG